MIRRPYAVRVAYDEDLAHRIRELVAAQRGVSEKKMFGGLAFLIGGKMAIAASRQGGVLVRVDPRDMERLVAAGKAEVAVMGARRMNGWLRVPAEQVRTRRQLQAWVSRGMSYARTLPAKV